MRQAVVVFVVAAIAAAASSFAVITLNGGASAASASSADASADQRMKRIEDSIAQLGEKIAKLQSAPDALASPTRIDESAIDRAARQLISERIAELKAGDARGKGASSVAPESAGEEGPLDFDAALKEIVAADTPHDRKQALWKQLAKAGKLDEAIDSIKEMTEQDPNNPALRVDLGSAYLQKLQTITDGPEKGVLAMGADKAFDEALKLDPNHWEARFTKAVSLSFWPPLFGKQTEAVNQFETLVAQQEKKGDLQPHYAQTYLFLGNLYQQQGNAEKAQQAWRKGLALFPNNADLKANVR